MRPDFLIIGSAKSGTTSLYHVLRQHPEVFVPRKKELHFFEKEHWYQRGIAHYERHFAGAERGYKAVGEATPVYICHPGVPARIKQHMPDVKLILTLRNPISRAYSQYWQERRRLNEAATFDEIAEAERSTLYEPGKRGYFSRGFYLAYIQRYLEHFDRSQLLILLFEDLVKDPAAFYRECFRFLGVDENFHCPQMEQNFNRSFIWTNPLYRFFFSHPRYTLRIPREVRPALCVGPKTPFSYPRMAEPTRDALRRFYRDANSRLADFLGRSLETWQ